MERTDQDFKQAVSVVYENHGYDEAIKFLVVQDYTEEHAKQYIIDNFTSVPVETITESTPATEPVVETPIETPLEEIGDNGESEENSNLLSSN